MADNSSPASRRKRAVESFGLAAACVGPCTPGMSLFAITRGQFSMVDVIMHVLAEAGPSRISVWTWTLADYEVELLNRLRDDGRITDGLLLIDVNARVKNATAITEWRSRFGPDAVRFVVAHAKMATVESNSGLKFLLRGSMNLNCNPRFEQLDITEGGADFDLVRRIEGEFPPIPGGGTGKQAWDASKLGGALEPQQMAIFKGAKVWAK